MAPTAFIYCRVTVEVIVGLTDGRNADKRVFLVSLREKVSRLQIAGEIRSGVQAISSIALPAPVEKVTV